MDTKMKAVETAFGTLFGRDAIFLDDFQYDKAAKTAFFAGEVNGRLCSDNPQEKWIAYELRCENVEVLDETGLDLFESITTFNSVSSFDLILPETEGESPTAESLTHLLFQTYDIVFEIKCRSFEFTLGEIRDMR